MIKPAQLYEFELKQSYYDTYNDPKYMWLLGNIRTFNPT